MANSFTTNPKKIVDEDLNLTRGIVPLRTDVCPYCKAQRVELFSFNGYTQNYKEAVNAYLSGYDVHFDKYEIRAMKCRGCNKEFVIDWTDGFPKPLKDTYRTNRFFSEFIGG